jgi:DNA replication protein DnaC
MVEHTLQQMAAMRLHGMVLAFEEQRQQSALSLSFEERLTLLIDREYHYRENIKLQNRLKQAKLKSSCSFEQLDFTTDRGISKQQLLSLSEENWIKCHKTIVITGATGTGKTFIAGAIAHKACLLGYTAKQYRLLTLLHDITLAYREHKLARFLTALNKSDVLVIDDFGMLCMDEEQKRLLLEIIDSRYETRSLILTSQLPISEWHEHLDDPLVADALLDRVVHRAEKIILKGDSLRKRKPNEKTA